MTDTVSLTMDAPIEHSLLDQDAQAVIGRPLDRVDGPLKVAGKATYAAEYQIDHVAHGFLIGAKFGRGHVSRIDAEQARKMPGVIDVFRDFDHFLRNSQQGGETSKPVQGVREVQYYGEPIAIVVAETFEQARAAAHAVHIEWIESPGMFDFDGRLDEAVTPPEGATEAYACKGDLDAAMRQAAVSVDNIWTTPSQNSAAMEMHASIASWDDEGNLTLHGAYQMPASDRQQLADALSLPSEKVRIIARYVGGGFGAKLGIAPESVAAALAAKAIGRPVKAVMTRQQVFDATVRRSNTRQRIRLGATADGKLLAIGHETIGSNLPGEDFFEPAGIATHFLYAGEARRITHDNVPMNRLLSGSMRAPGEAAGMLALECAMDELAQALDMDPVAFRKLNEPAADPQKDQPFSSRRLVECYDDAAAKFGWDQRNRTPGGLHQGEWLVGHGMAASARSNKLQPSKARVAIEADGRVVVETDMTDIGTGTYTILAQIAGELLGQPLERVEVRLGDNRYPPGAGSGGSFGAGSSGTSVYVACKSLREQIAGKLSVAARDVTFKDGMVIAANRATPLGEVAGGMEVIGEIEPGKMDEEVTQASYGAHFCEVHVNVHTGETRVKRWVSSFAAGRILNEKTARSQCIGGIVFGIGAALHEEAVHDWRNGKIVNHDLAEYHVPAHADVPHIDVTFLPERDVHANPMQAKGIGELGISGAGAAVVNAIYNATGVRVRDYPVTLDKLLAGLPGA